MPNSHTPHLFQNNRSFIIMTVSNLCKDMSTTKDVWTQRDKRVHNGRKVRVREFGILKTGQTEGQKIVCLFLFVVVDRFEGLSPLVVAHVSSACVVCWVC